MPYLRVLVPKAIRAADAAAGIATESQNVVVITYTSLQMMKAEARRGGFVGGRSGSPRLLCRPLADAVLFAGLSAARRRYTAPRYRARWASRMPQIATSMM